jgi:hypothetical protein
MMVSRDLLNCEQIHAVWYAGMGAHTLLAGAALAPGYQNAVSKMARRSGLSLRGFRY